MKFLDLTFYMNGKQNRTSPAIFKMKPLRLSTDLLTECGFSGDKNESREHILISSKTLMHCRGKQIHGSISGAGLSHQVICSIRVYVHKEREKLLQYSYYEVATDIICIV